MESLVFFDTVMAGITTKGDSSRELRKDEGTGRRRTIRFRGTAGQIGQRCVGAVLGEGCGFMNSWP